MAGLMIREEQKLALKYMLNLNEKVDAKLGPSESEPVWKLLIYDSFGQDIISPILNIKELRSCGITLHLKLHSDRDAIPDVPAIYFVTPSDDNINRICNDMRSHLYDQFFFNFITPISRQKLEDLASAALQASCSNSIRKVFDQYLNFISLEDDMFVLREHQSQAISYYAINKADTSEAEMHSTLDSITDGLFSVLATLSVVPIIRSPTGNAAELVAQKLYKKIKDNLQNMRSNLFPSTSDFSKQQNLSQQSNHSQQRFQPLSFQRPLLLILDRNIDLATPLHHTWTYQALIHDVLTLKLNQIRIVERTESGQRAKNYDLSTDDKIWQSHKGSPFPQVAEAVQEELDSFRAEEERLKSLKNTMGVSETGALEGNEENLDLISDTTARITSAVTSLPELLEKKKLIDMHTSIATEVLEEIKKRKLDVYFELEEKLLSRNSLSANERSPLELIEDQSAGSFNDKIRLLLINYICSNLTSQELADYERTLVNEGIDLSALKYIKRWKSITNSQLANQNQTSAISGGTRTVSMFSKLMNHGSQFVMEGVKNLVVKKHNLPVTRIVDNLMELKNSPELDEYLYLDPKILKANEDVNLVKNRTNFNEAIVFMIGGGNYIEYQNLMDYCKYKNTKTNNKKIIYGCTDLVNADQFLKQITRLGQEG